MRDLHATRKGSHLPTAWAERAWARAAAAGVVSRWAYLRVGPDVPSWPRPDICQLCQTRRHAAAGSRLWRRPRAAGSAQSAHLLRVGILEPPSRGAAGGSDAVGPRLVRRSAAAGQQAAARGGVGHHSPRGVQLLTHASRLRPLQRQQCRRDGAGHGEGEAVLLAARCARAGWLRGVHAPPPWRRPSRRRCLHHGILLPPPFLLLHILAAIRCCQCCRC